MSSALQQNKRNDGENYRHGLTVTVTEFSTLSNSAIELRLFNGTESVCNHGIMVARMDKKNSLFTLLSYVNIIYLHSAQVFHPVFISKHFRSLFIDQSPLGGLHRVSHDTKDALKRGQSFFTSLECLLNLI